MKPEKPNIKEKILIKGGSTQCKCFSDTGKKEFDLPMTSEFSCKEDLTFWKFYFHVQ